MTYVRAAIVSINSLLPDNVITRAIVDVSSNMFGGIHLRDISQKRAHHMYSDFILHMYSDFILLK